MKKLNRRHLDILYALFAIIGILPLSSCSNVPDNVIPPDEMAQVLADLYMAESVVELNYSAFADDSARMALKQSIVESRGYSLESLDTSFMWYGANLKEFDKMQDRTQEILTKRLAEIDNAPADSPLASTRTDSTDIWPGARYIYFSAKSPSTFLTFDLDKAKAESKTGDIYTWRAKFINNPGEARWSIVVDYADGSTEIMPLRLSGDGWKEIIFYSDSTKVPRRVYGALSLTPVKTAVSYVDSIQLIRHRFDRNRYGQRYRQRTYRSKQ